VNWKTSNCSPRVVRLSIVSMKTEHQEGQFYYFIFIKFQTKRHRYLNGYIVISSNQNVTCTTFTVPAAVTCSPVT